MQTKKKETLLTKFNQKIIKIKINEKKISNKDMLSLQKIGSVKSLESEIQINYKLNKISMKNVIEILYKTGLDIIDLSTKEVSLEDVFINLTSNN